MGSEDGSIEVVASERRERLKALRAAQELLSTPDGDSAQVQESKNDDNESSEEMWVSALLL